MASYLSAFAAKRKWRDRRWRIDGSLMTQSGHRGDWNPAVQRWKRGIILHRM